MKKLVVLMLVFGMASMANAAMMSFENAGGGTDVDEFTVITINIIGDVDCADFRVSAAITGDFSNVALGSIDAGFDYLGSPGQLKDGSVGNVYIFQEFGMVGATSPLVTAGAVLGTFTLTAGAAGGTITIDDYAGMDFGPPTNSKINLGIVDMAALPLNIIPEPMTIALLGLGGLALLRRRK